MADPEPDLEFTEPLDAHGRNSVGQMGCVMRHHTGQTDINYWFRFMVDGGDVQVIEWPLGNGMFVVTGADMVATLVHNGWARPMTAEEIAETNKALKKKEAIDDQAQMHDGMRSHGDGAPAQSEMLRVPVGDDLTEERGDFP